MTKDETNTEIGRILENYAEVRRKIVCLRHRISSHHDPVLALLQAVQEAQDRGFGSLEHASSQVAWSELREDAARLSELRLEKERLESYLREAGLGEMVK